MRRDPVPKGTPRRSRQGQAPGGGQVIRAVCFILVLLTIYASLYPFSGWRNLGVSPFAYLKAPWPQFWVRGEIWTNVFAYIPLGVLLAWSLFPRCRGLWAVIVSTVSCMALSVGLEALQTFLPNRVASNIDLAANASGGLIGALIGVATVRLVLADSLIGRWRYHWFDTRAALTLSVAGLWVFLHISRQEMLFGTGDLQHLLGGWSAWPLWQLESWWTPRPQHRAWAEHICTGLAILGATLFLSRVTRPVAWRGLIPVLMVLAALGLKTLLQPVMVSAAATGEWFSYGALLGVLSGVAVASCCMYLPEGWQRLIGGLALLGQVAVVNFFPTNAYFVDAALTAQVDWFHAEALLLGVAAVWPWLALLLIMTPVYRRQRSA